MKIFKTLLSSLILLFTCTLLSAQFTKSGNFIMGSTIGFSTAQSNFEIDDNNQQIEGRGTRSSQFNIAPAIGYFLTDNFAMGVGLDYTSNITREPESILDPESEVDRQEDSDLLFGPFARYYLPIGEDKAFFLETTFGIGSSSNTIRIDGVNQNTSTDVLALGIGPGFTIFSRDGIGIEALVKYNWARSNTETDFGDVLTISKSYTNAIDLSIGMQIYFGRIVPATSDDSNNSTNDRDYWN
ncbi:MAG TPA: outer membrane beta-barrel protein [Saprospiraceae bacterium]|nr:outer membrane beta-barrel protein [Saprospiraceae bacterium]